MAQKLLPPQMPGPEHLIDCMDFDIRVPDVRHMDLYGTSIPTVVVDERESNDSPNILLASAWSASGERPYQRARMAMMARALGARVIGPATIGQGIRTSPLESHQRAELHLGDATSVSGFMTGAALDAVHGRLDTVHVVGVSQGPLIVPGMVKALAREEVDVESITLLTPASTFNGSTLELIKNMVLHGGKFMKEYRALNPAYLQTDVAKDTKIVRSILTQFRAHVIDYPRAMTQQNLAEQLAAAIRKLPRIPRIKVVTASEDKVSTIENNTEFVERLRELGIGNVEHEILEGHYHAVTEHAQYMAHILRGVIRPADTL